MNFNHSDDSPPPARQDVFDFASVPWYTEAAHYEQFRTDASDAESFFSTFQEWLVVALEHERQAERHGVPIIRVRMFKSEFDGWCQSTGFKNDAEGRSVFAEHRAQQLINNAIL